MNANAEKTPAELLLTPVQFLKGVGPQRAELLERLGLRRAVDLLFFFPRSYQDMSELRGIPQLEENVPVSICGVVEEIDHDGRPPVAHSPRLALCLSGRWWGRCALIDARK